MCKKYHMLSKIDDPSMKHAFITSFLKKLSNETFRIMKFKNKHISITSLGEILQHVMAAVEKLRSQHTYFKDLIKGTINMKQGCKRPNFSIKCDDEKICVCRTKKKKHFRKYKFSPRRFKGKPKMSYLRKKKFWVSNKSNRCYICHKKGHYVKNCPNKVQIVKLVDFLAKKTSFDPEDDVVESIFSLDDELSQETLLALKLESSSKDEAQEIFKVSPAE